MDKEDNKINRSFLKNITSTYKYGKKAKSKLVIFLIGQILLSSMAIVFPILGAKRIVFLTSEKWNYLLAVIFMVLGLEMIRLSVSLACHYSFNKYYYIMRKNLQLSLTEETIKIKQEVLNTNNSGVFIERIVNDTDNLSDIFAQIIDYVTSLITNLGILVSVFFINIYIGIAYLLFIVINFIYNKFSSKINYNNRKEWKKSREKTEGFISEIVRGAKDIKILNAEKSFLAKADEYIDETNNVSQYYHIERRKLRFFGGCIRVLADFTIALLFYIFLLKGKLSIEMAIILFNYHWQILATGDWIQEIFEIVKHYNLASNRIFGILEENEFEKESFGTKKLKNFEGNIEFKDVHFSYEDNIPVLKGLNLKINANEVVGFVGPSGAGKSTIFNLISAINRIDSGSITFDGVDINELNKDSIRGNLSVISQNAYIYNMSIYDNLKVVKNNATLKEIKEACKLACLDEFIEGLPEKYDTIVGEGGVTLSGGQKQRLAIARALLLKTEILLFDEATSALDNETQYKIQEAINNLKGEYTILIIAHRLSTVMDCDKIFVIDDGKVSDEGTHKYLLKNSKVYNKLYKKENDATK